MKKYVSLAAFAALVAGPAWAAPITFDLDAAFTFSDGNVTAARTILGTGNSREGIAFIEDGALYKHDFGTQASEVLNGNATEILSRDGGVVALTGLPSDPTVVFDADGNAVDEQGNAVFASNQDGALVGDFAGIFGVTRLPGESDFTPYNPPGGSGDVNVFDITEDSAGVAGQERDGRLFFALFEGEETIFSQAVPFGTRVELSNDHLLTDVGFALDINDGSTLALGDGFNPVWAEDEGIFWAKENQLLFTDFELQTVLDIALVGSFFDIAIDGDDNALVLFEGSGKAGSFDFAAALAQFDALNGSGPPVSAVPLPASLVLFLAALGGLGIAARGQKPHASA